MSLGAALSKGKTARFPYLRMIHFQTICTTHRTNEVPAPGWPAGRNRRRSPVNHNKEREREKKDFESFHGLYSSGLLLELSLGLLQR